MRNFWTRFYQFVSWLTDRLAGVTPAPAPAQPAPQEPAPSPDPLIELRADLLLAHNRERQKAGAGPLRLNNRLNAAAQKHAETMGRLAFLDHHAGNTSFDWRIAAAGYGAVTAAENIAWGALTVPAVMFAWIKSEGHRNNILSLNYVDVGFGFYIGADSQPYWCTVLALPGIERSGRLHLAGPLYCTTKHDRLEPGR
jgi:uncharacterized protein YkwD